MDYANNNCYMFGTFSGENDQDFFVQISFITYFPF